MNIVQITDLHLCQNGEKAFHRADATQALKNSVNYLLHSAISIDLVVVSGDISTDGSMDAYETALHELKRLPCPVYYVPGNHDCCKRMEQAGMIPVSSNGTACREIDLPEVSIILMNTAMAGESRGFVNKETLEQLREILNKEAGKPTFLFMHHVPFVTGFTVMDEPFSGVEEFNALISKKEINVCCGHIHAGMVTHTGLATVITCPPICMEMELDFTPAGGDMFYVSEPQFAIHCVNEKQVVTHFAVVPTAESRRGPYPFSV
ncbi:metallophosphoesterase [Hominifimenecus sp. rT4P-3]|uniref:metallophosphoesterase n=1 Tax=Hominifimenecus sp. rT4P-3 TaxID=3242979 RepID=UPI003DA25756